jgi:hypothetical protein
VNAFAVTEPAVQACAVKAPSTAMARAMARRMGNAEGVRLRGMRGRDGFVHGFSQGL